MRRLSAILVVVLPSTSPSSGRTLESYVSKELIDALTIPGRIELLPAGRDYKAFVDPSGGSADSMCLAIAHAEDGVGILDLLVERRPPFSPALVVADLAERLKQYGSAASQATDMPAAG